MLWLSDKMTKIMTVSCVWMHTFYSTDTNNVKVPNHLPHQPGHHKTQEAPKQQTTVVRLRTLLLAPRAMKPIPKAVQDQENKPAQTLGRVATRAVVNLPLKLERHHTMLDFPPAVWQW